MSIKVLGVVVSPTIKGLEWENKATFDLPIGYCKYMGLKPKDKVYIIIRKKDDGLITIFINSKKDTKFGTIGIMRENCRLDIKNYFLGLTSKDFFEASLVKYDNKTLSIRLQQIKQLPRYMEDKKK